MAMNTSNSPQRHIDQSPTFHPFLKLAPELQSLILSFTDLVMDLSEHEGAPIDLPFTKPHLAFDCPCNSQTDNGFWKDTCGLCDRNKITKGLFWVEATKQEAMKIFYSSNQIDVADWTCPSYSSNGASQPSSSVEVIQKMKSVPYYHLYHIKRLCIDLSGLASSCFAINHPTIMPPVQVPSELRDILQFIQRSFSGKTLSITFSFKLLAGSVEATRIIQEICRRISQVNIGDVSMILGADYFDDREDGDVWYILSGTTMDIDLGKLWNRVGKEYEL